MWHHSVKNNAIVAYNKILKKLFKFRVCLDEILAMYGVQITQYQTCVLEHYKAYETGQLSNHWPDPRNDGF